ncbi:MAG: outer membrane beta-barrel protein [Acidobacteriota bacterium]
MRTFHVVLSIMLLALAATPARADGFVTPFYGFNFGGDSSNCATFSSCDDKRANFGVSIGKMGPVLGFEEDISFAKDFFGKVPNVDNSVFTLMSNVLIGVGAGPVQPYVLAGAGLIRPHASSDLRKFDTKNNSLGYDLGAGVNGYVSRHVGIRGDIRRFHTLQDVDIPLLGDIATQIFETRKLDFWRASFGIAFRY